MGVVFSDVQPQGTEDYTEWNHHFGSSKTMISVSGPQLVTEISGKCYALMAESHMWAVDCRTARSSRLYGAKTAATGASQYLMDLKWLRLKIDTSSFVLVLRAPKQDIQDFPLMRSPDKTSGFNHHYTTVYPRTNFGDTAQLLPVSAFSPPNYIACNLTCNNSVYLIFLRPNK